MLVLNWLEKRVGEFVLYFPRFFLSASLHFYFFFISAIQGAEGQGENKNKLEAAKDQRRWSLGTW